MGRSLLTDEIIERANRGEIFYDDNYLEDEETKVIRTDQYDTLTSYDPYEEYEDSRGVLLSRFSTRSFSSSSIAAIIPIFISKIQEQYQLLFPELFPLLLLLIFIN